MWLILLVLALASASHFDDEFGFELVERTGCDLKIWASDNTSPYTQLALPSKCVAQYPNGLAAVPVLHENQSVFLYVGSDDVIHVPKYLFQKDSEDQADLWVETFRFNNDETMVGMVLHINQNTFDAKLYHIDGEKIYMPTILVLRQYEEGSFVSLVEELGPLFAGKVSPGDLITFVPPSLTKMYKDVFDLVGIFSEYSAEDPVNSFNDVRRILQTALGQPLTLLGVQVK